MSPTKVISRAMTVLLCTGAFFCIVFAATVALWAIDRDAPFVMLDYKVAPAKAGQSTVVKAMVRRDLSRRCSVLFSRSFYDSTGSRFELTDGAQLMNSSSMQSYNQRSPDMLVFNVDIQASAAPGFATVMTVLDYQCNPIHQFYPIAMVLTMDLEVLK